MSASLSRLTRYKPSGAINIFGLAAALVISAGAGVILAAVYAFANHHDPLIFLNVLLSVGFGLTLGWLVSWGVRKFRIRNRAAAALVGLMVFAAAYAAHWPVYVATVLVDYGEDIYEVSPYDVRLIADVAAGLTREPREFLEYVRSFNEEGVWSMSSPSSGSKPVKGILLALIWALEALVIAFYPVTMSWEAAGRPYSERQEEWLKSKTLARRIAFVENKDEFANAILRGDYSALSTPIPDEAQEPKYAEVTLYADAFEPYVSVMNVKDPSVKKETKPGLGKKFLRALTGGEKQKTTRKVVQYLKIPPTVAQNISSALESA